MTVTAMPGTGRRHRVVATGLGFGRSTATKALKHSEVDITDAVAFLTRITGRDTAHVLNQMSLWPQAIPTSAAALTTVGALITLYVAIVREPKNRKGWH
jgi:dienelactone hydrolase